MVTLYCLILIMLLIAFGLLAIPFLKNKQVPKKYFLIMCTLIFFFSLILYFFLGSSKDLNEWLAYGKSHYDLQVQIDQLGGIDGIIAHIQEKLAKNPNDAKGWLILGKLYLGKHDYVSAKFAFKRAREIEHKEK